MKKIWGVMLILLSCSPELKEQCENLSARISQGNISLVAQWEQKCQGVEADLTPQKCRQAFQHLVTDGRESFLTETYGPQVMRCFTEKQKNLLLVKE